MSSSEYKLMIVLVLLVVNSCYASVFDCGIKPNTVFCTVSDDGKNLVVSGNGDMDNYNTISTCPFGKYIETIEIKEGVTSIGQFSFAQCSYVNNVKISNTVKTINGGAFYRCKSLTQIDFPTSITTLGNSVFEYCTKLEHAYIPSSVTHIGNSIFLYCSSIKEIEVDSNNKYYFTKDGVLFDRYNNTLLQYPIGNERNTYAIPDFVNVIGSFAFCGSWLTQITIPNSVIFIGNNAFSDVNVLKEINIPDSVKMISSGTFFNCSSLNNVILPNSISLIGEDAFKSCSSLTNIVIPSSVKTIENWAFWYCRSLKCATFEGINEPRCGLSIFYETKVYTVHVPNAYSSSKFGEYSIKKDSCQTCDEPCSKCIDGYINNNDKCEPICEIEHCKTCLYPNICSHCENDYFVDNGKCSSINGINYVGKLTDSSISCLKGNKYDFFIIKNCWKKDQTLNQQCIDDYFILNESNINYIGMEFWPCISCGNFAGQVSTFWKKITDAGIEPQTIMFMLSEPWTSSTAQNQIILMELVNRAIELKVPYSIYVHDPSTFKSLFGDDWIFENAETTPLWSDVEWKNCGGWKDNGQKILTEHENIYLCTLDVTTLKRT